MEELCAKIAVEKDHRKFLALVQQLNSLLQESQHRLNESGAAGSAPKIR